MAGRPKNKIKTKRIAITLELPLVERFQALSDNLGIPLASLISKSLKEFVPAVEDMVSIIIQLKEDNEEKMLHILDHSLQKAELDVETVAKEISKLNSNVLKHKASFDDKPKNEELVDHDRLDISDYPFKPL